MLELKNLSFAVEEDGSGKQILEGITLTVPDDRFIAVTGPNGSGKSTLARLIAGIEKPIGGQIIFNGRDITDLSVTERALSGISFAFQQPVRFKGIRVIDLLRIASHNPGLSIQEACDALSEVGLCAREYVNREINASLSGGELKRIEIASVMVRNALLTIFDEPEAGIDLWSFRNLIEVFQRLRKKTKGTVLVISHQERILNIADEIAVIDGGRITMHGPKDEILPKLLRSGSASSACIKAEGRAQ
ncbi:MAG: ATP-binding cassette domain-containing protein [Lachnospiraceae bacterium]|nr:ATP-binding cassette domain-containing protein [Lachnospiraceae bacterium]